MGELFVLGDVVGLDKHSAGAEGAPSLPMDGAASCC